MRRDTLASQILYYFRLGMTWRLGRKTGQKKQERMKLSVTIVIWDVGMKFLYSVYLNEIVKKTK